MSAAAPALALTLALALAGARAAEAPPDTQELYQEALLSIAEGRKNDASETLSRVIAREPLHAGAWLDLALIQCGLGRAAEAERLFGAILQRFDPPAEIVRLIGEARANGCGDWQGRGQYSVSLGRGVDQNVNQGATDPVFQSPGQGELVLLPEFQPKHDQYSLLEADYLRDISPNGSVGFLQFQGRRYDRLGQYDSASLFAGVESPWRFGRWTARASATLGLASLGGALYQRQGQLQLQVGPPLPLPGSVQFNLSAALGRVAYLTLSNFDTNTAELRGQFTYRAENSYASASLGLLDERAAAGRPGGDRHGRVAALGWRHTLAGGDGAELAYSHQRWAGAGAYAPGLIELVRRQSTSVWRAALVHPLGRRQQLRLELRQLSNRENIGIFQYNGRQLQLSWQWQGP